MDRDLSRSRAVLIGNATYQHPDLPDLPAARACVTAMEQLLTGELCGWPTKRVTALVGVNAPHELASRMVGAVRDAEDVLLLYYVGHGLRTSEGQLALALGQTDPHPELRAHTGMLYENLAKILRGCRAATKLVILDCCHAELGSKANYVFQSADLADAYPVDGLYFVGASAKDKNAKAPLDGSLTYFTDAFITVVNAGIPGRPAMLRLDHIFLELRGRLMRANRPEPVESGTRGAHQFPFARNAAPTDSHLDPEAELALLRQQLAYAQEAQQQKQRHAAERPDEQPPIPRSRSTEVDRGCTDATGNRHRSPSVGRRTGTTTPHAETVLPQRPAPTDHAQQPPYRKTTPTESATQGNGLLTSAERLPWLSRRRFLIAAAGATVAGAATAAWLMTPRPAATPLGLPLNVDTDSVYSVAFSPDGRTLASSGVGNTIQLWNLANLRQPIPMGQPLNAHTDYVYSVAFSPDGRTLASGSYDRLLLWNLTNLSQPTPLDASYSRSVAFSPDGRTLASGNVGNTILLWNLTNPSQPRPLGSPLTGPTGFVSSVAFSPDGRTLASGNAGNTILLWNLSNLSQPTPLGQPLNAHTDFLSSVAFSPDGRTLASGADYTLQLWNLSNLNQPTPLGQPLIGRDEVSSVAFSPDGRTLASGVGTTVRLWDLTNPSQPKSLGSPLTDTKVVSSVAFSPDGRTLASAGVTIRLWDLTAANGRG